MKQAVKTILRPVIRPFWRRVWFRIEGRVAPLENSVSSLDARVASQDARVASLDGRVASLDARGSSLDASVESLQTRTVQMEQAWHAHIPSFLNAVASVPSAFHQLAELSARVDEAASSHQVAALSARVDEAASSHQVAALSARLEETASSHQVAALSARLDETASSHQVAELSARLDETASSHQFAELSKRLDKDASSITSLWERIEFVRREILFEFSHGIKKVVAPDEANAQDVKPRIISTEKCQLAQAKGQIRLNLGCGHIPLVDYINVDARDLPGVDLVADIGALPFEQHSVDEIFSAHLIEHFPLETMRRRLLPYWRNQLKPGGTFRAVTPDAASMLQAAATGSMSFDDFREVVYGAQDYDGDYHFNLFTPDSLKSLLQEAGFKDVSVPVAGRRNGKCFEFEIVAIAP